MSSLYKQIYKFDNYYEMGGLAGFGLMFDLIFSNIFIIVLSILPPTIYLNSCQNVHRRNTVYTEK